MTADDLGLALITPNPQLTSNQMDSEQNSQAGVAKRPPPREQLTQAQVDEVQMRNMH